MTFNNLQIKTIRYCGWFSLVVYTILSLIAATVAIAGSIDIVSLIVVLGFISMARTGWNTFDFKKDNIPPSLIKLITAIISLIFGGIYTIIIPKWLVLDKISNKDYLGSAIVIIIFIPSVITSIALLFKTKNLIKAAGNSGSLT